MKNIVTISREYGSGGYEVGRRVAEAMNYKFYDKELIAHIADKFLIPESFVAATEETELRKKNIFHEVFPVFTRAPEEEHLPRGFPGVHPYRERKRGLYLP